jgi:outer membrane protein assembly factor BamE (lipoprotein component of BamABCDE complex)
MLKILGAAALSFMVIGCASSGTKVDPAQVQAFQRGKTTYTDVVGQLGSPNSDTVADDGSHVIAYMYTHAQARPESFVPLVGPLIGGADAKTTGYIFTFDNDGVLRKVETSNAKASAGMGFAAGSN